MVLEKYSSPSNVEPTLFVTVVASIVFEKTSWVRISSDLRQLNRLPNVYLTKG